METKQGITRTRPASRQRAAQRPELVTCSVCLRVLQNSVWVDAVDLIRSLRTYELKALPTLQPALCDRCERRSVA